LTSIFKNTSSLIKIIANSGGCYIQQRELKTNIPLILSVLLKYPWSQIEFLIRQTLTVCGREGYNRSRQTKGLRGRKQVMEPQI
jgi:hypothetical protein